MAAKTATVIARMEPEVKREAESVLEQLGVPASTVINMLYRQIALKRRIPFEVSLPSVPPGREEMSDPDFDAMLERGLEQARENRSQPLDEAISSIRDEVGSWH